MQCTLLIPHLFWPQEAADAVASGLELPAFRTLLGRSRAERFDAVPYEGWLCRAFQVERQQDWPVAPLTLTIDGGEIGDAYCLRADPVHLKMQRDRLLLIENALFDVSADDAQALVSSLNQHFAAEGIAFYTRDPKRWYAKVPRQPKLVTRSMSEVAGNDVDAFLPTGEDALPWHRLFNEAQMVLHASPASAARDERGEPAVNSVWFWGGGVQTRVRGQPYATVWSDDALAVALATLADIPVRDCPDGAEAVCRLGEEGSAYLIVLSELSSATGHHDSNAWRERMSALETRWFAPMLRALRHREITRLSVVVPGAASCWRFDIASRDLLKFWRSARPWSEYS
jgi:hypothetical protein